MAVTIQFLKKIGASLHLLAPPPSMCLQAALEERLAKSILLKTE